MPAWTAENDTIPGTGRNGWFRGYNSTMSPLVSQEQAFSAQDPGYDGALFPSVARIPNAGEWVAAFMKGNSYKRPYLQRYDANGAPTGTLISVDTNNYQCVDIAVDSFYTTAYGDLIAVAWTDENLTTNLRTIKFRVYRANGQLLVGTRSITPTTDPTLWDGHVAVAGVDVASGLTNAIIVAWDRYYRDWPLISNTYLQTWQLTGTALTIPLVVDDTSYTYKPDLSARVWAPSTQGTKYQTWALSYLQNVVMPDDEWALYPTFRVFKNAPNPVDVTGAVFFSWYPQHGFDLYGDTQSDSVSVELFNNCTNQVVVGAAYYTDHWMIPQAERGVRRGFISVVAADIQAQSALSFDLTTEAPAGLASPYRALENGGRIDTPLLLAP